MVGSLWRRLGYPDEALKILSNIEPNTLVSYTAAGNFFIRATVAWERGEKDTAHELLERCLDFAEPEGVAAPFINMDKNVRDLLVAHIGQPTKHRDFVLAQIARDDARIEGAVTLSSPLSGREQEVLGYLESTMSAQEIADTLVLSVATIRSHQQSIYRKLAVKNRKDAVKAARSLGLLRIS
ncbi:response regulator transcription factor [Flaviflexus massiliensis]|uniref:response regulator transcription factor n=1 Tax=Flaviflexus massiliensis TaxID=1522309 RepID=UPI0006D58E11|nr:LuxR C-terminal-related transcriptional regulator [Flaviflexus massiliensis]